METNQDGSKGWDPDTIMGRKKGVGYLWVLA
jgi:hypothetical protein